VTTLPPFSLHRPATLEEATGLLERHGDDAVVYVGGTELFLLFKFGFAEYPHVIDLKGIDELRGIERRDGHLRIGAAETHRAIERHPTVRAEWPALAAMERAVGNLRVRTMGSIGGNLCFADPHSDPATFLLAMDGVVEARRGGGEPRRIALAEFVRGPFENALEHGELLTGVLVPEPVPGARIVHRKFVLHERPAITVTCHLRLDGERLADVRLGVGSAGITAARATAAEELLSGAETAELDGALEQMGELAAEAAHPVEDANGSVEYKRNLVAVLSRRAVHAAITEARGGGNEADAGEGAGIQGAPGDT
jgi:aerobic carbon-monoxide dehydrogenase medium subunit